MSFQIVRNELWLRSWGARPAEPDEALGAARVGLKRVSVLVPLNTRSLKKQRPTSHNVVISSSSSSSLSSNASRRSLDTCERTPRWIEFWSEASINRRWRNSSFSSPSTSSSSPTVLREGGWEESDVAEIIDVSASGVFETELLVMLDHQAVFDVLLLKADRFSDSLRKAGWSSEEVLEILEFEFRRKKKQRKPAVKLSPKLVKKIVNRNG